MTQPSTVDPGLLTADEQRLLNLLGEVATLFSRIVGHARTRQADLAEGIVHVHAIQATVMSQAAARAYPDNFRLLGETLHP